MSVAVDRHEQEVLHGWTRGDILDIARYAVRRFRAGRIASFDEYLDIAVAAIEDKLLDAAEKPTQTDLLRAAGRGIYAFGYEYEQANGWDHKAGRARAGYLKFWTNPHPGMPEEIVVDKMAVRQILPTLTQAMRDALLVLALYDGDGKRAAAVLGISYSTFRMRIKAARDRFQLYWFEGQTPPGWYKNTNHGTHMRAATPPAAWAQDKGRCRRFHGPDCGCWIPPEQGSGSHDD